MLHASLSVYLLPNSDCIVICKPAETRLNLFLARMYDLPTDDAFSDKWGPSRFLLLVPVNLLFKQFFSIVPETV